MPRTRADRARIAELEQWHAAQDCAEHSHTYPDGYGCPDPDSLADVRETVDVSTITSPMRSVSVLVGLPDGVTKTDCVHCGARLFASECA